MYTQLMSNIKIFESKKVRAEWDAEKEDWWFSVVDVCEVLSESPNPRNYWNMLKRKLKDEGSELYTNPVQLKLQSADGKYYATDVLDTKGVLRLVQSIPSPKAEPFKMWLAQVGTERLDTIADPEKALRLAADLYKQKGYTDGWIRQRLQTIEMRNKLEDEWQQRGAVTGQDYAILTNEMTKAWSGMTVKEYKEHKELKKENLRDNMTDIELVLNMLAEVTTTRISQKEQPETMAQNVLVAIKGGRVANNAKLDYEQATGEKAISSLNAKGDKQLLEVKKSLPLTPKK